jgi:hypothetical protein
VVSTRCIVVGICALVLSACAQQQETVVHLGDNSYQVEGGQPLNAALFQSAIRLASHVCHGRGTSPVFSRDYDMALAHMSHPNFTKPVNADPLSLYFVCE